MYYQIFLKVEDQLNKVFNQVISIEDTVINVPHITDDKGNHIPDPDPWSETFRDIKKLSEMIDDFGQGTKTLRKISDLKWVKELIVEPFYEYFLLVEDDIENNDFKDEERKACLKLLASSYNDILFLIEMTEEDLSPNKKSEGNSFQSNLDNDQIWILFSELIENKFISADNSSKKIIMHGPILS